MRDIQERVYKFFIALDERDWEMVERLFAERVEVDYFSMNGHPTSVVKAFDIIQGWKGLLPGFTATQHQIGNLIVKEEEQDASVFCYGTAAHYLEGHENCIWRVVGSYDIDLKKIEGTWRITKIKLNFKYEEGNKNLPSLAAEIVKTRGKELE